jgi:hypothetical protein
MPFARVAVMFAALWTAGMLWWNAPLNAVETDCISIEGLASGAVYAWHMGKWVHHQHRRGR